MPKAGSWRLSEFIGEKIRIECECGVKKTYDAKAILDRIGDRSMPGLLTAMAPTGMRRTSRAHAARAFGAASSSCLARRVLNVGSVSRLAEAARLAGKVLLNRDNPANHAARLHGAMSVNSALLNKDLPICGQPRRCICLVFFEFIQSFGRNGFGCLNDV